MASNRDIDGQLVLRIQSGESIALPVLVKRWHKEFCKKAYWLVKDQDVAKDIAQDSWKTIIDKIDLLNDPKSFGSWALRIVYNKSLDLLRANAKEREQRIIFARTQDTATSEPNTNDRLKLELLNGINQLPSVQLEVIKLYYIQGYKLKEIGDLLNISIGTAKSRLFHARERLKNILKQRNYEN